ncbi:hypothetical protein KY320_00980 [Candidatus Woesearchaeota archaeon]|nr:hypothetical protein [Candidatus Woesearchaeota archaeon]
MKNLKSQLISFDFGTSIFVFILFFAIFISLILMIQEQNRRSEFDFEFEYLVSNLENNLRYGDANKQFLADYRVNEFKLGNFALAAQGGTIELDEYVFGRVGEAHGIGLSEEGYDACLYFTDKDGVMTIPGNYLALGKLEEGSASCNEKIAAGENPCGKYSDSISLFRPLLFYTGSQSSNRIVQMNLVVCKI